MKAQLRSIESNLEYVVRNNHIYAFANFKPCTLLQPEVSAKKQILVDFGHVVAPTPFVPVRRDLPKKMQYQKWHLLSYLVKLRGTAPKSYSQKTV